MCAGSIIVTFDLVGTGGGGEATLAEAVATLQSVVEAGSLLITDLSGNTLTVDTSSFSYTVATTVAPDSCKCHLSK